MLGCASATIVVAPQAKAKGPAISVGEPAGFADLTAEQTLLVDVYFGGVRRGEAMIVATPDTVRVSDVASIIALLPTLADQRAVEAELAAATLPANSGRACTATTNRATCGRLSPETIGVILDRNRLRLDVFLNPRLIAVHDNVEQQYLPAPSGGLSMVNAIGALLSGSSGSGTNYHNLQDQLVIAQGAGRVRADLSHATGFGFEAERLVLELDRPELRYAAGALWAPGNELTGRRKLLGLGVETQIDTRLDKDAILGSPVTIYLDHRARVDIVRDGRLLGSAIYEAGNQQLETSNLPEGSYELVLRVDEPGRAIREEQRFFTKSRRIPSKGRTDFFAFGGMQVASADSGSLRPSNHPYFQGGASRRLSDNWAVEGEVQASHGASAEIGATLLTPVAQLRAAAVADLDGRYGAIFQIASSATSRLNVNLDLRRINGPVTLPSAGPAAPADPFPAPGLARLGASYSQAGGIVSYSLANMRFVGVFSYRDTKGQESSYSIGPSLQWDVMRKGPFTLTMRGEMAVTDRGTSEFAGISFRVLGQRASVTALGGRRSSNISNDELGNGPIASIAGSWSAHAAGGELALGAGYDHQPRQDDLLLSSQFDHPLGSVGGDFVRSDANGRVASQYSVGLRTTVTAGAGALRVAGKTTTQSMITARVIGARPEDRFEILVDEQVAGTIVGKHALTLALPTYRAYQVRIRPTGKNLLAYDNSPRSIGLYPGAVTRIEWKAAPVTIKFGRLVSPDGAPVAHASITSQGVWAETDDDGLFQIEAPNDAELTVGTRDGRSFAIILPEGEQRGEVARLGTVICCDGEVLRFGALDPLSMPDEKGRP
jgi:hypothetical protein